jgi:hypothetical protein
MGQINQGIYGSSFYFSCRCVMIYISFVFLGGGFISAVCDSVGVVDWFLFLVFGFWEAGCFF